MQPRLRVWKCQKSIRFLDLSYWKPASLISSAPTVSSQQQAGRAVQDAAGVAADPSLPRRHLLLIGFNQFLINQW